MTLLVDPLRSNDQTYEVHSLILWKVYFGLKLVTAYGASREASGHTTGAKVTHSLDRCHFECD